MLSIFPSLISADLLNLRAELATLDPYCDGYHIDVMDGHFVPNITWGPAFVHAIAKETTKPLWVHLMTTNPEVWIDRLCLPSQSMVDFHKEVAIDHVSLLHHIKTKGWKAGITINPSTPVSSVLAVLPHCDYVVIMSVEPGFSGQLFIPDVLDKTAALAAYRAEHNLGYKLCMDGGINTNNIHDIARSGVECVAAASALFDTHDPVEALQKLKLNA